MTRLQRFLILLAALAALTGAARPASAQTSTGVRGWVDGLATVDGATVLRGWACDVGKATSIAVHLYAGGGSGTGSIVKTAVANVKNEGAIDTECQTSGVPHRFQIPITGDDVRNFATKGLYVHGISTSSGPNSLLNGSGTYAMPAHLAFGAVESVTTYGWAPYVSGWACDVGVAAPVTVELYSGGPFGAGTLLRTSVADVAVDAAISSRCGTTGIAHRFRVPLTISDVRAHGGEGLYLRARSASGGATLALGGSGNVVLPEHMITGNIDGVRPYQGHDALFGWACDYGVASSVAVHLYVGGPAGQGTILKGASANQPAEQAVNTACGTPAGTPHRFIVPLDEANIASAGGKAIYVHGIRTSTDSPGNLLIGRSGLEAVPSTYTLGWSTFKSRLSATDAEWEIPSYLDVVLDQSPLTLPLLHVMGQLRCGDLDLTLSAQGIMIDGPQAAFECGTAVVPYTHQFKLTLRGDPLTGPGFASAHGCEGHDHDDHPSGPQSIVAKCGGHIRLHGDAPAPAWTRLAATAPVGASTITVRGPVDWRVGERVAIASTSFVGAEADEATITAVNLTNPSAPVLTLDKPLAYRHIGAAHAYSNGKSGAAARTWTLDQAAEVALLSRNIVIEGTECDLADPADKTACLTNVADPRNKLGGHVMITAAEDPQDTLVQIDAVELRAMGRLSKLGRYPLHWHRVGPTSGDYVSRSSFHHTFQRCLVLHGTHGVAVDDNVCFDHYGHGYMLEDGDEHDNSFTHNLGFVSRRPPIAFNADNTIKYNRGLLVSDNRETTSDRWSSPATYWITNPDNVFDGNVAAGSQGTGFWFAFVNRLACTADAVGHVESCRVMDTGTTAAAGESVVYPVYTPLAGFSDNVTHSSVVGVSTDGAPHGAVVTPCDANGLPTTLESNKCNDRAIASSHYSPRQGAVSTGGPVEPYYTGLSLSRHTGSGFYFRGDRATVDESVIAESVVSAFFDYNQTLQNSLVVGLGPELGADQEAVHQATNRRFFAVRLYDGPFTMDNVHLAGFTTRTIATQKYGNATVKATAIGHVGGANKAPTNRVRGLTAVDCNPPVDLTYANALWPSGLYDEDGSLTGAPGSTLIPYGADPASGPPLITSYPECPVIPGWNARLCPAGMSFGSMTFFTAGLLVHPPNIPDEPITLARIKHVTASNTDTIVGQQLGETNKLTVTSYDAGEGYHFFSGADHAFVMTLPPLDVPAAEPSACAVGETCNLRIDFKYVRVGARSPILRVVLPANADLSSVVGLGSVTSEQALETSKGYYLHPGGRTVSLRLEAAAGSPYILADAPFDGITVVDLKLLRKM